MENNVEGGRGGSKINWWTEKEKAVIRPLVIARSQGQDTATLLRAVAVELPGKSPTIWFMIQYLKAHLQAGCMIQTGIRCAPCTK